MIKLESMAKNVCLQILAVEVSDNRKTRHGKDCLFSSSSLASETALLRLDTGLAS